MREKGAQWLVTLARLGCTSATSVPPFSHPERYLVGAGPNFGRGQKRCFTVFWRFFPGPNWDPKTPKNTKKINDPCLRNEHTALARH